MFPKITFKGDMADAPVLSHDNGARMEIAALMTSQNLVDAFGGVGTICQTEAIFLAKNLEIAEKIVYNIKACHCVGTGRQT